MHIGLISIRHSIKVVACGALMLLSGCGGGGSGATSGSGGTISLPTAPAPAPAPTPAPAPLIASVSATPVATFASPWGLTFLPDGRALVSQRLSPGRLSVVTAGGTIIPTSGLPSNVGILDVALDPQFAANNRIYFSYMEEDSTAPRFGRNSADLSVQPQGLAVARGTLAVLGDGSAQLTAVQTVWRQFPKVVSHPGSGEPGGHIAFSPDGRYLFIAAGDRQEFEPVQLLDNTLGKVVRIFPDGSIPADNPFVATTGARRDIWTLGHRNPYGLAFDAAGTLWLHEHGPSGGDELNLIAAGGNYGWPNVSFGSAYTGEKYTDPRPGDGYVIPSVDWTPAIAPAGMIFYSGSEFAAWRGDAIIGGLQSRGIVRVRLTGTTAAEIERMSLSARIRDVGQSPDGGIWVLEDGTAGRLLRLRPTF